MARTRQARPPVRRGFPVWPVVIGLVLVCGIIAVLIALATGGDDAEDGDDSSLIEETAPPVEVTGQPLPDFTREGEDLAVGQTFPTLAGVDLEGQPLTVPAGSQPMIVLYLAHWCPHCQREVPTVQQWVDDGSLPSDVELVGVSTGIDPSAPNYPPSEWFEREGWTAPTLVDPDSSAAAAAGLTTYPYFVAVDGEGRVIARASGELTTDQLDSLVEQLTA
jgi:cytochrome c biogenesis protein CcmG, thiol:disulfide interchange protein DsbE